MSFVDLFGLGQAWAAETEQHAPSINQIWFPLANFLIFAFIVARYALPLVRNFLQARREEVSAALNQAAGKKRQAEALVQDYKDRLARLGEESQAIQAALREEGEREKRKLLTEAETLVVKINEDARFLADQEVRTARQKLRAEMARQAEATAREIVQRHLSPADQARLVGEFIQSIGQVR